MTTNNELAQQTSSVLLSQLGGLSNLRQMLGIKFESAVALGTQYEGATERSHRGGLSFRLGVAGKVGAQFTGRSLNHIVILLDGDDTYRLLSFFIRGVHCKLVDEVSGIHAPELAETFYQRTGLVIPLPKVRFS